MNLTGQAEMFLLSLFREDIINVETNDVARNYVNR